LIYYSAKINIGMINIQFTLWLMVNQMLSINIGLKL